MLIDHRIAVLSLRSHIIITLLAPLATLVTLGSAHAQSGVCTTDSPGGHKVTVCITQPANGETISAVRTVTATVSASGSDLSGSTLLFSLDGTYLLTDFDAPYTFELPTYTFTNGAHTLSVAAVMRDDFTTSAPAVTLNFSNAGAPPTGPDFVPVTPGPRLEGQSLIMAAVGDGASGEANAELVTRMVDGWNPDLFLYLGDVYDKGTYTEFYNWYGQSDAYYGRFRDVTNPVIGNHEYETGDASGYFTYWNNVPNYYSYDAGGWHFIALNSNRDDDTSTTSPQYQWLLNDVAGNTAPCSVAYFHHPVLSVALHGDTPYMNPIWRRLAEAGVDIVLTGHDHNYQRWAPLGADLNPSAQGTTQFVAGTGGHGVRDLLRSDARLAVGFDNHENSSGSLYFKLNPKGAEFSYVNTAEQVLDHGIIPCSGANDDTAAPAAPNGLTAASSADGHVSLSWNAAWDDTGVAGYGIYRDGALIATVGGAETSYVDVNVGLSVTYTYAVDAVDPSGLRSAPSNTATITRPAEATLVFNPAADTYVQSDKPSNFGTATTLRADASPDIHSLLRFDVQGITGTITSATLRVYANSGSKTGYQVHSLAGGNWTETGTTYGDKPPIGGQVATSGSYGADSWTQAELLPHITGNGELDIALKTTSNTLMTFSSREGANPPQLVVNVVADQSGPTATPTNTP